MERLLNAAAMLGQAIGGSYVLAQVLLTVVAGTCIATGTVVSYRYQYSCRCSCAYSYSCSYSCNSITDTAAAPDTGTQPQLQLHRLWLLPYMGARSYAARTKQLGESKIEASVAPSL